MYEEKRKNTLSFIYYYFRYKSHYEKLIWLCVKSETNHLINKQKVTKKKRRKTLITTKNRQISLNVAIFRYELLKSQMNKRRKIRCNFMCELIIVYNFTRNQSNLTLHLFALLFFYEYICVYLFFAFFILGH